ncbi:iron ABC transporter permease [Spongorhabdus nitratireducens]
MIHEYNHSRWLMPGMMLVCLLAAVFSLQVSPIPISLDALWSNTAGTELQQLMLTTLLVPRTLMALLCGAALGIAGSLIQLATRNSFASPATLGVNAGALLATVLGMALVPGLMAEAPVVVAFGGALVTTLLVIKLSRMIGDSPVNLVLVGMAITLALGAVSAGLMMFLENRLDGLYTWGAGNLAQHDFSGIQRVLPVLLVLGVVSWTLGRKLDLIELGRETAQGLGVNVAMLVNGALLVAIVLSSLVVSEVGMISFIGLVAPPLARSLGFRTSRARIPAAAVIGAGLLLAADITARFLSGQHYSLPAGAMTTLLGAPFMIWMLVRRRSDKGRLPSPGQSGISALISMPPLPVISVLAVVCGLLVIMALGTSGISDWLDLRGPRVLVAAMAGIVLGISGLLLQTLLKNPLASPDVSGLTTTGVLFAVLGVVLVPGISSLGLGLLTLLGSVSALGLLLLIGRMTGFQPQLFALTGLCLSALAGTLINIVLVLGSNQTSEVLVWLSGSTYHSSLQGGFLLAAGAALILVVAGLFSRQLDILQLGETWSGLLGINSRPVMLWLLAAIALTCSLTVAVVGGISFVGLMAPHICRVIGLSSHRHLIPAAALTGAILMIAADWLARSMMYPFELPAGLVVSCLGGLYFVVLLLTGRYVRRT